ncbi:hypothetical protein [Streptomyces sp. CNQ085]|uniref:hypothetical protein n=1 Tax=Streptomyces sp. CNQ085 TaxID=2886944 RepID=UPI001F50AA64|nr:hypothetical protein [Streptomyces sp. CNQ085]MCI0384740.1 hypothetical protein [Streptomyces sp. CNQ085]
MAVPEARWERRLKELWASFDDHGPGVFLRRIESLAAELPPGDAVALYEPASALVPHLPEYRRSLSHYARALTAGGGA